MSTSSTWSAARTTASGTVSRCLTPVIRSTTSLTDSRCWMLTVVITSMPASSGLVDVLRSAWRGASPGTLVWAISSMSTTSGRRARTASMSSSSNVAPRWVMTRRGTISRSRSCAAVLGRPWVSTKPDHHVGAATVSPPALVEHGEGLAHARRSPEVDAQVAAGHDGSLRTAGDHDRGHDRVARSRARLSSSTFTPGSPSTPGRARVGVGVDQVVDRRPAEPTRPRHPRSLEAGVGHRDLRIHAGAGGRSPRPPAPWWSTAGR